MAWSLVQSVQGTVGSATFPSTATSSVTPSATGVGNLLVCVAYGYCNIAQGVAFNYSGAGAGLWNDTAIAYLGVQPGILVHIAYILNAASISTAIVGQTMPFGGGAQKLVCALNFYEFTNTPSLLSAAKVDTMGFPFGTGSASAPNPGTSTTVGINELVICGAVSGFVASTFTNCIQGTGYTIGKANATAQYQSAVFFATTDQYSLNVTTTSTPTAFATEATASWAATALGFSASPGVPNSMCLLGSGT